MKTKKFALGATFAIGIAASFLPGVADAALTIETFSGDATFTARCNQDTGNTDCEDAVAEGRAGDRALNGDWEVGLGVPNTHGGSGLSHQQFVWGASSQPFTLAYTAATNSLQFTVDSLSTLTKTPLNDPSSIFIRARGNGPSDVASLTNLVFNGQALADLSDNSGTAKYLAFTGFATTADWTLTGDAALTGTADSSKVAFQIKLTDAVVTPLPAAAWLFGSAFLGLCWLGRRSGMRGVGMLPR